MDQATRWRSRAGSWALLAAFAIIWPLALPYSEATRNANEIPRVLQSVALADAGTFEITHLVQKGNDPGPDIARIAGRVYPNKPPAVSVLGALTLRLGDLMGVDWNLRSFTFALRFVSSFLPTLLLLGVAARRFGERYGHSVFVVAGLLYAVGTPVLSYSRLAYGHTLAGAMSMIGVLLLLAAHEERRSEMRATLGALGGGALCSLAISADYMAVFWGPVLAVGLGFEAFKTRHWRLFGLAAAGALVGILPLAIYHQLAFDSIWSTGYHHSATQAFAQKHQQGLLGLRGPSLQSLRSIIWSPGAGLLWWIPLFFVGALGLWYEQRASLKTRLEGRLLLGVLVVGLAVNLGLNFEGGWRVGPRYLQSFLPAMIPGLAFMLARERGAYASVLLLGSVVIYSLWVNLAAASLWPHFDLSNVNSPIAEVLWPLIAGGYAPHGLARQLSAGAPVFVYLLFPLGIIWYFYGKLQFVGYRVALCWVGATLLGTFAATVVPRMIPAHPASARNLEYIQRAWEPRTATMSAIPLIPASRLLPRER